MYSIYKIRLHIEREHECGQLIEEILHIESADFSINMGALPPFPGITKPWTPRELGNPNVTFTGKGSRFEGHGFALNQQLHLVCLKCGGDLTDPPKKETDRSE